MWKKIAFLFKGTFRLEEIRLDHLDTDKGQIQANGPYKLVSNSNHFHHFGCCTFCASVMITTLFLASILTGFCCLFGFSFWWGCQIIIVLFILDRILPFLSIIPDITLLDRENTTSSKKLLSIAFKLMITTEQMNYMWKSWPPSCGKRSGSIYVN